MSDRARCALTPSRGNRCTTEHRVIGTTAKMRKKPTSSMGEESVLLGTPGIELREALIQSSTASCDRPNATPKRRVVLVQTQAENAGAQEISRLLGAGLTARGYEVFNLFLYRKSDSFDEPPNTFYCSPSRPGNPLALL